MIKQITLKRSLLLASLLVLPVAHATALTKADFNAGKTRISIDYKADKSACASQAANAKDVCIAEAKAREKVARTELNYDYSGKAADQNKILVAKAETAYAVAKERCDDLSGNPKDVCVKEAKAVEIKALADAKLGKQIGAAQTDAAQAKRDANYKVAAENCNALAGDAKANCMASAKAQFGKT